MSATLTRPDAQPAPESKPMPLVLRILGSRKLLWIGLSLFAVVSIIRATQDGADDLTSSGTIETTLRFTMPILLAGLAGLWAERVGIVNIGIEGMMIFGTWFGGYGAWKWGPWVGLLTAVLGGMLGGLIHAVATVTFNVNHVISGVAMNTLAFGSMRYLSELLWDKSDIQGAGISQSPQQKFALPRFDLPFVSGGRIGSWQSPDIMGWFEKRGWPILGDIGGIVKGLTTNVSAGTIIALSLVPISAWVLWRTKFGLRLRSSGESPQAAESLGVKVIPLRYYGLLISGGFAGLGGGYLAIVASSYYRQGQTAQKGFIGIATTIAGNWRPSGVLASGFLFGYPEALNRVGRDAIRHLLLIGFIVAAVWCVYSLMRSKWIGAAIGAVAGGLLFDQWLRVDADTGISESLTGGLPYAITLVVLAVFSQRLRPPAHAGMPYRPGDNH
ncbi:MAG TPA: ABC transporter permease [Acidimicrobiaceae bacterium]|nr:ABC transporter permease [Acidimicrobiaceae bacterium]